MGASTGFEVLVRPHYWPDWVLSRFDPAKIQIETADGVRRDFRMHPFRVGSDGRRLDTFLRGIAPNRGDKLLAVAFNGMEERMFLRRLRSGFWEAKIVRPILNEGGGAVWPVRDFTQIHLKRLAVIGLLVAGASVFLSREA
ncbi:MAG: hypothetical protein HY542_02460 [Deltaproteobacteria bacterium]|nr:hypothetical protein [Deltaproteobacteria bacterium]